MGQFCSTHNKPTMKQKILYFMPDCPTEGKAGNITRCQQMLSYLNAAENCEVDFVSLSDWGIWSKENIEKFHANYPNINLILTQRKISQPLWKKILCYKLRNVIPKLLKGTSVDITNPYLRKNFSRILNAKTYDRIIISYVSWGKLIETITYKSYLILDTHDFITAQNRNKTKKIGRYFQTEMNIINLFNEIWTFSPEEKYIFEQFSDKKVVHLPIAFPQQPIQPLNNTRYDIIFIGSNNPHNIKGIHWFLEKVLPLLNDYHIHIIGKVCETIDADYPNTTKHGMVEDLEEFYSNAKLSICPMLSGTGVKIKVLESLSHNIPVVTNPRGVDGLSNKTENGCVVTHTPMEFAQAINRIMTDDNLYENLRKEAYNFFNKNHHISKEIEFFKQQFP